MSILIRDMKMPMGCWDCPMCYDMIGCSLTGERWSDSHVYLNFSPGEERMCNCPLVELPPHGRLIDADDLCFETVQYSADVSREVVRADDIIWAPTIIEATDGGTK